MAELVYQRVKLLLSVHIFIGLTDSRFPKDIPTNILYAFLGLIQGIGNQT
jgi:hypothetical protein